MLFRSDQILRISVLIVLKLLVTWNGGRLWVFFNGNGRAAAKIFPRHRVRKGAGSGQFCDERAAGGASRVARVVRGQISQMQLVPVSARRIMPGERVSAGDIRMVHLDIRQVPPNAITVARELEGLEPRWPVAPNAVMTRAQLKAPAMIERGDIVTAEYRANNIELTTKVIADESGSRGQVIRVRNPSSNKTIQGRISDVARVTID